jgi:hypothetical protein
MSWLQRHWRVFAITIETCAECGGKLRVIACIEQPQLTRKLPGHVRQRDALRGIKARAPSSSRSPTTRAQTTIRGEILELWAGAQLLVRFESVYH